MTANNTAASLRSEIDNRVKSLAKLTTEAARSDAMRDYLETCARFHNYSPYNQMAIWFSNPNATRVAGFNTWKEFGRFVKKGEHGIPILAPIFGRKGDEKEGQVVAFRVVYVFDVSQTDGAELTAEPNWKSPEQNEELQLRLTEFAKSMGIEVEIKDTIGSGAQGSSSGGKITLVTEAGTKTLIHEIAHEMMHRGPDRNQFSRDVKELEAEAVAFVVGSHFGLDELSSPNYLALWEADEEKILGRMDRIRKTAAEIIKAVEPKDIKE